MKEKKSYTPACPIPITDYPNILLAHGGGGKLMHDLLEKLFIPLFENKILDSRHDSAELNLGSVRLAFTTDSYVVKPLFFPGGDIGSLAVYGTVNDLAMSGARPLYLSVGFILEEGLPVDDIWKIARSMKSAAAEVGASIVTGDTKVVDRGKGDGVFINTAGIGLIEHNLDIGPRSVKTGDAVILSGDIGRHGMAILAARENLNFEIEIESDCAPLTGLVDKLISSGIEIHCLRDLTRGGLASALVEIAQAASVRIDIVESLIPVQENVRGACEILGFDPIYVANEGRMALFLKNADADRALAIMRADALGAKSVKIGEVTSSGQGLVTIRSRIGVDRIVDMISGEQLPRIC
jgi:hydrogenase expression/formation protein HypE